jgi:hypothetical protein
VNYPFEVNIPGCTEGLPEVPVGAELPRPAAGRLGGHLRRIRSIQVPHRNPFSILYPTLTRIGVGESLNFRIFANKIKQATSQNVKRTAAVVDSSLQLSIFAQTLLSFHHSVKHAHQHLFSS